MGSPGTEAEQLVALFPSISTFQKNIIREMVAVYLSENKSLSAVDLEPLNFKLINEAALAADVNPFLIAVEFALQGKTILISDSSSRNLSDDIRSAMLRLGVPPERISIMAKLPVKNIEVPGTVTVGLKAF